MRRVTVALAGAGRLFARVARVFNHLAAGTLRIADLRVGIEHSWERFTARDANVAIGLLPWEERLIARFVAAEDRVLLVGSGPGRDFIALVEKGFRVTGVEPARRAIATSRQQLERRGLSAEIIEGFFEEVPVTGTFDVIIFSHCCYSFIPQSKRRIDALRKAGALLSARGRIIISYMTEQSGHPSLVGLARFAATVSRSDWRPERGDVIDPLNTARPLFHYEHPFRPGEIDSEASAAGLREVYRDDSSEVPSIVFERT